MKTEEPYYYLQKNLSFILKDLSGTLNERISEFKRDCKEAYEVEEKIIRARRNYIAAIKEIEEEEAKQKEMDGILEYFEGEVEKLLRVVYSGREDQTGKEEVQQTVNFEVIGEPDRLLEEFRELMETLSTGVPQQLNSLLTEVANLLGYAESLIEEIQHKGRPGASN